MKRHIAGTLFFALGFVLCMSTLSSSCTPKAGELSSLGGTGGKGGAIGAGGIGGAGGAGTGGTMVVVTLDLNMGGAPAPATGTGGSTSPPSSTAPTCGTTTADTKPMQADMLIVLDRTNSMTQSLSSNINCDASDPTCISRMTAVVAGVGDVVTNNPGIHWGLELYTTPGGGQCVVSPTPQVAISADSSAAIKTVLATVTNEQSTPTALALTVATNYLKTVNDGNSKAILLATDGEPNCGSGSGGGTSGSDLAGATAAAKAAYDAGFSVYVIGIGPSVSNLNALAQAGGTSSYYPATSTTELNTALSSIAKVVSATCTFKASTAPPDSGLVYVYVDKRFVAKDEDNGWTFDTSDSTYSTITLTGTYCDDMLAGTTSQVQIVFGCPYVDPPPFIP